jgi:AcrR family transcriptional regulator
MRGVAERLGVHPSALNYHVENREELVDAVATSIMEWAIQSPWAPADDTDWRQWVRAFAGELRNILLSHNELALYFRFMPGSGAGGLDQFDRFLGSLFAAGFDEHHVALATTYIAQVVFMSVRDELMARRPGRHPQDLELERTLDTVPSSELQNVRRLLAGGGHGDPVRQFAFDLDCVIAGLEVQLTRSTEGQQT